MDLQHVTMVTHDVDCLNKYSYYPNDLNPRIVLKLLFPILSDYFLRRLQMIFGKSACAPRCFNRKRLEIFECYWFKVILKKSQRCKCVHMNVFCRVIHAGSNDIWHLGVDYLEQCFTVTRMSQYLFERCIFSMIK